MISELLAWLGSGGGKATSLGLALNSQDQAGELLEEIAPTKKGQSKLATGLIGLAVGVGISWGVYSQRVAGLIEAGQEQKQTLQAINTGLQANLLQHAQIMQANGEQDRRITELERGREANRIAIDAIREEVAALRERLNNMRSR